MPDEDDVPPTLPAPAPPEFEPEENTAVVCLACGGTWQRLVRGEVGTVMHRCQHCTSGAMTAEQVKAWKERKTP